MSKHQILYIEDNDDNFRLVERILKRLGLELDRATTAASGIQMAQTNQYALVLTDILLPDNSIDEVHYHLLYPLRQQIGPNVPLVAVTAHAFHFDEAFLLAHGCDYFVAKPLHVLEFQTLITQLLA
ncbi:response regulator [Candidatus Leptofilum sp.]|uniref:response regulator n=1 Tax=Candidatus Leptofilum sp. TaxID=3241576 RepID=UPI003B5C0E8B